MGETIVSPGRCQDCGTKLAKKYLTNDGTRVPCPKCGSMRRAYSVHVHETVKVRTSVGYELKRAGKNKFSVKATSGASFFRKTGDWHNLERVIDRENDKYKEKIVDEKSGEVLIDVEEPLSQHKGHGDAKHKRKK